MIISHFEKSIVLHHGSHALFTPNLPLPSLAFIFVFANYKQALSTFIRERIGWVTEYNLFAGCFCESNS